MKVWITKDALEFGIQEAEAEPFGISGNMILAGKSFFHKSECHTSKEEALIQAEKMRQDKTRLLEKQLEKLKAMKFE
jgi:ABC-type antimicrobial peptide transport system ATPase subunit